MRTRTKYAIIFGLVGFAFIVALAVHGLYFDPHNQHNYPALNLMLCPPCLGVAILLGDAEGGFAFKMIVYSIFSLVNTAFYAVIGLIVGSNIEYKKSRKT